MRFHSHCYVAQCKFAGDASFHGRYVEPPKRPPDVVPGIDVDVLEDNALRLGKTASMAVLHAVTASEIPQSAFAPDARTSYSGFTPSPATFSRLDSEKCRRG